MLHFNEIDENIEDLETLKLFNTYRDNTGTIISYWKIGELLYNSKSEDIIIKKLVDSWKNYGSNYTYASFKDMKELFIAFPEWKKLSFKINWSVYRVLVNIKDTNKRNYYYNLAIEYKLSATSIKKLIHNYYYENSSLYKKDIEQLVDESSLGTLEIDLNDFFSKIA